jgi:Phosphate starvation-inducible protein PhoH, predicted ATPase
MNQKVNVQKDSGIKEYFHNPFAHQNTLILENDAEASILYGSNDRYLRLVRDAFQIQLVARHGVLKLEGEKERVSASRKVLSGLLEIVRTTGRLDADDVEQAIVDVKGETGDETAQTIDVFQRGLFIKPKTEGQAKYIEAIKKNDLVLLHRTRRHGKNLSGGGDGAFFPEKRTHTEDCPCQAGCLRRERNSDTCRAILKAKVNPLPAARSMTPSRI